MSVAERIEGVAVTARRDHLIYTRQNRLIESCLNLLGSHGDAENALPAQVDAQSLMPPPTVQ